MIFNYLYPISHTVMRNLVIKINTSSEQGQLVTTVIATLAPGMDYLQEIALMGAADSCSGPIRCLSACLRKFIR